MQSIHNTPSSVPLQNLDPALRRNPPRAKRERHCHGCAAVNLVATGQFSNRHMGISAKRAKLGKENAAPINNTPPPRLPLRQAYSLYHSYKFAEAAVVVKEGLVNAPPKLAIDYHLCLAHIEFAQENFRNAVESLSVVLSSQEISIETKAKAYLILSLTAFLSDEWAACAETMQKGLFLDTVQFDGEAFAKFLHFNATALTACQPGLARDMHLFGDFFHSVNSVGEQYASWCVRIADQLCHEKKYEDSMLLTSAALQLEHPSIKDETKARIQLNLSLIKILKNDFLNCVEPAEKAIALSNNPEIQALGNRYLFVAHHLRSNYEEAALAAKRGLALHNYEFSKPSFSEFYEQIAECIRPEHPESADIIYRYASYFLDDECLSDLLAGIFAMLADTEDTSQATIRALQAAISLSSTEPLLLRMYLKLSEAELAQGNFQSAVESASAGLALAKKETSKGMITAFTLNLSAAKASL